MSTTSSTKTRIVLQADQIERIRTTTRATLALGISFRELAWVMGVSDKAIYNWLAGYNSITADMIGRFEAAVEVTTQDAITRMTKSIDTLRSLGYDVSVPTPSGHSPPEQQLARAP